MLQVATWLWIAGRKQIENKTWEGGLNSTNAILFAYMQICTYTYTYNRFLDVRRAKWPRCLTETSTIACRPEDSSILVQRKLDTR